MDCVAGLWIRTCSRCSRTSSPRNGIGYRRRPGANLNRLRREKDRVSRQIDRLVDALADGEPAARLTGRLRELEKRRLELERELEAAAAPVPRLHPNIAEVYRRKVEELHSALRAEDAGPARELIRGLVEAIVLIPEEGRLRVEVRGELAAILRLSGCANEKAPAGGPELLAEQIKMVAGARSHCHYAHLSSYFVMSGLTPAAA